MSKHELGKTAQGLFVMLTLIALPIVAEPVKAVKSQAVKTAIYKPGHDILAYKIQPGDVLQVSVWNEPNLQKEVMVRPDGGISLPLAGEFAASNKTIALLRDGIKKKIGTYIPNPEVTVSVVKLGGNKIYILGKVNRPGEYVMNRPTDVMQALSMAAGTARFADLDDIKIIRRDKNNRQKMYQFNYKEVQKGKNLVQNILLVSGDIVVVP